VWSGTGAWHLGVIDRVRVNQNTDFDLLSKFTFSLIVKLDQVTFSQHVFALPSIKE